MPAHSVAATLVADDNIHHNMAGPSSGLSTSPVPLEKGKHIPADTHISAPQPSTSFLDDTLGTLTTPKPFFVLINESKGGLVGALHRLNDELVAAGHTKLISGKKPWTWTGKTVLPGEVRRESRACNAKKAKSDFCSSRSACTNMERVSPARWGVVCFQSLF